MEIIAVVAILSLLVAATLPALVKKADDAAETAEIKNLETLATGFQQGAVHLRYIPSFADWADFIASNVSWQVTSVQTNSRKNARVFLVDPAFSIGLVSAASLPYAQGTNAYQVTSPRFLLVSSISKPLPISSGSLSQTDFDTLWNYPDNGVPAGWSGWQTAGVATNDLKVRRIDLTTSFRQLVLTNPNPNAASFSIDDTPFTLAQGSLTAFLFAGTALDLLTNSPDGIQAIQVLNKNVGWIFTNSITTNSASSGGNGKGNGKANGNGKGGSGQLVTNSFWIPQ
jgi:hypothetical protein